MKWRRLVQVLFCVTLILLACGCFIIGTQDGLRFSLHLVKMFNSGNIYTHNAKGNLLQGFTLEQLHYHDTNLTLSAKNFSLRWRPLSLLKGELDIAELNVKQLHVVGHTKNQANQITHTSLFDVQDISLNSQVYNHQSFIEGAWQNLIWHPVPDTRIQIPAGQIKAQGRPSNYIFTLKSNISSGSLPKGNWLIQGHGDQTKLAIDLLIAKTLKGTLVGNGQLTWQPKLIWNLKLRAQNFDLNLLHPNLNGTISAQINSRGQDQIKLEQTLTFSHLSGQLQEQAVSGEGQIQLNDQRWQVDKLNITIGRNYLHAQGRIDWKKNWDLSWDLKIDELAQLINRGHGQFSSKGRIRGAFWRPDLQAQLQAKELALGADYLQELQANINLQLASQHTVTAQIQANDINYGQFTLNTLAANLSGTTNTHNLNVQLQQELAQLNLNLQGSLKPNQWLAQINQLQVNHSIWGQWQASKPSSLSIGKQHRTLQTICLHEQPDNKFCVQGNWQTENDWSLQVNAQHLPLNKINQRLPPDSRLHSFADLNLNAKQSSQGASGQLQLSLTPGSLSYIHNGQPQKLSFQQALLHANLDKQGLQSKLYIQLPQQQKVDAQVRWPTYLSFHDDIMQQPLQGQIAIELQQLGFLLFGNDIFKEVQGSLQVNSSVHGNLQHPKVHGQAKLAVDRLDLAELGTSIKNLNVYAQGDQQNKLTYRAQAQLGPGTVKLSGQSRFDQSPILTHLQLKGDNLLIANTREYKMYLSPDLTIDKRANLLTVNGKVHIPEAYIKSPKIDRSIVRLPNDVVITKESQSSHDASELKSTASLQLSLGDKVEIDLYGLSGQLQGDLDIQHHMDNTTRANGTIKIHKGRYTAYGQDLTIAQGELLFAGGLIDNPGLNIRAERAITQVPTTNNSNLGGRLETINQISKTRIVLPGQQHGLIVGLNVKGRLKNPKLSLFSEPANLNQSDILSYLLFGRSIRGADQADAQTILSAASALNLGDSDVSSIQKQIKQGFGLDELAIESRPVLNTTANLDPQRNDPLNQNTSLVLGKALSPRLYINYSIGLLQPINTLKVRYLLGSHWSVQTETNTSENGIDLFYSIER